MRKISSDEATIDDAFEVAQLMIEEGNTEHGVQLLRAAEIARPGTQYSQYSS